MFLHPLLKGWRVPFALAVFLGLVGGLGSAGLISMINLALSSAARLDHLLLFFAALAILVVVARISSAWLVAKFAQELIYEMRLGLSRDILAAPLSKLQVLGAPRILASLTDDVAALAMAMQALPWLCVSGAIVLGCLLYMGYLAWPLLLLVFFAIVLGTTIFALAKSRALSALRLARQRQDEIYSHFRGLTEGIKELKLNRARCEAFFSEKLGDSASSYRRHSIKGQGLYILAGNIATSLLFVVIGAILFGLPANVPLSNSVVTGFILALIYLMAPLAGLVETLPVLSRARVAHENIETLRETLKDSSGESKSVQQPGPLLFPGVLEMIGVTHSYRVDRGDYSFTLGPVDLTLHPGEVVFLVGGNGSGKTTLALLLVGLYTPENGMIRLGGRPVNETNREQYRQHFSTVFSDFYLFDTLLGLHNQELDAEAASYLAQLQLDHKVRIENSTFSTLNLSQGQRKRLALLVAYLEDRPFYVFDEWAADQDPIFKKIFYMEILPALKAKGKTVVVITHDDQYFHVADRCLKLDSGALFEIPRSGGRQEIGAGMANGDNWNNNYVEVSP